MSRSCCGHRTSRSSTAGWAWSLTFHGVLEKWVQEGSGAAVVQLQPARHQGARVSSLRLASSHQGARVSSLHLASSPQTPATSQKESTQGANRPTPTRAFYPPVTPSAEKRHSRAKQQPPHTGHTLPSHSTAPTLPRTQVLENYAREIYSPQKCPSKDNVTQSLGS